MENLELKHIVGYLPYGLKVKTGNGKLIRTLNIEIDENFRDIISLNNLITGIGHKPILRPLSDLTKEIEVNGEKFVPIKNLGWEYYDGELGSITNCVYGESPKTTVNVMDYLYDLEQLYEWHFDIHGLIESGLAIDINT